MTNDEVEDLRSLHSMVVVAAINACKAERQKADADHQLERFLYQLEHGKKA